MRVKINDLKTGETRTVNINNPVSKRVMLRAVAMYTKAKEMGIHGIMFTYYLKYSWELERGKVWA